MKTIAFLPVDDRPVNYDYPQYLARIAGLTVRLPPREWLGNPWRESRHENLLSWLTQAATGAEAVIVAIDTLGYGGLIPSRRSTETTAAVLRRLEVLRELKSARPERPILASSVIMRIHRSDSAEEEKPYWALWGRRLFRLSFLEHKADLGAASAAESAERDRLRAEIPADITLDYRAGRERNHAVNAAMLDWVAEGIFDYLLLPQDDTADYGWNIAEARRLDAAIRARGLADRAITYPGADEIGCLLLARQVGQWATFMPRIAARFSTPTGAGVVTDYEDRPLIELLRAHLSPLSGSIVESSPGDLEVWFNSPSRRQGNSESQWILNRGLETVQKNFPPKFQSWLDEVVASDGFSASRQEVESSHRHAEPLVGALLASVRANRAVALADVAFVNAADANLGRKLISHPEITGLAGFGGWNTAGNTLGMVLAQAVIFLVARRETLTREQISAQLEFLFLRFVDDYLYQAEERTRCMVEDLPALGLAPTMERLPDDLAPLVRTAVESHLLAAAQPLVDAFVASGRVRAVRISRIHLPWQRLFEVGFDVSLELA
ncbi:MAG TPA: DUF4127 family protein [Candidatus Didemnitutus sp.]|nr:DUF4127 family protein [Candidatus Didemnitutus sp.]